MKKTFVLGLLILLLVQCNMKKQVSKIPVEAYSGTDLGLTFQQELIQFKVYSPKAEKVLFNIYQDNESEEPIYMLNLAKQNDIWVTRFSNEYQQLYYTIKVFYEGKWLSETVDPYVKMTSANGKRGFIGNPNKFSPPNWKDEKFAEIPSRDAIIYELHVRDLGLYRNRYQKLFWGRNGIKSYQKPWCYPYSFVAFFRLR
jgi:pullulanase/glycogen debranching enzyme